MIYLPFIVENLYDVVRPSSDIGFGIDGWVCNRRAKTYLVQQRGKLVAFVVLEQTTKSDQKLSCRVLDYAGERSAIIGVLGKFIQKQGLQKISIHVMGYDTVLKDLLQSYGLNGSQSSLPGTIVLVNFEQLLRKCDLILSSELAKKAVSGLVFKEVGDQYHVYYGGDRVVAESKGEVAELIFGTWSGTEEIILDQGGQELAKYSVDVYPSQEFGTELIMFSQMRCSIPFWHY